MAQAAGRGWEPTVQLSRKCSQTLDATRQKIMEAAIGGQSRLPSWHRGDFAARPAGERLQQSA